MRTEVTGLEEVTYLDNLTVRPLLPEAKAAFDEALARGLGDPRSTNSPGREARKALEALEARTAEVLGGSGAVFFSDGDMAGGVAVLAAGRAARASGKPHVISSPLERTSIVTALRILRDEGSRITLLHIAPDGKVLPGSLNELTGEDTGLLTCARANGISGVVQPVEEMAAECRGRGIRFHCDATYAAGRVPLDLSASGIDSVTVSSVQLGGPPGSAAVVLRDDIELPMSAVPEFCMSFNIPGISGMVTALESSLSGLDARSRIVNGLRSDLLKGLDSCGPGYSIIGEVLDDILPGTALLQIQGGTGKLHARMEMGGIILPSHNSSERLSFLRRTGRDMTHSDSYVGFTLDYGNSCVDVEHFVRSLAAAHSG